MRKVTLPTEAQKVDPSNKLLRKLRDLSPTVRATALQELSDTNYEDLPNLAISALADKSPVVRATALEFLTRIGYQ